jgi:hypothetical protein
MENGALSIQRQLEEMIGVLRFKTDVSRFKYDNANKEWNEMGR